MNVLICIDDLPTSEDTLALAVQWLERLPASVTLLTVGERAAREAALRRLSAVLAHPPTVTTCQGKLVDALCAECAAGVYDLLIVAPAGRNWLARFMRGSRIQRTVQAVAASVLIARRVPPAVRRILVGVSTAEHALVDLRVALYLARAFEARLTLLHVVSQVPLMFSGLDHMRLEFDAYLNSTLPGTQVLASARQLVAQAGLEASIQLREGLVREEITREAAGGQHDLVVIGAHGGQDGLPMLLDDISAHVVRDCPISTLVVWEEPRWGV
ncbi:MAG: universal stress protein [Thermoflexales bacterium]|nr:universal stress protein [Thermoflexales bacterium]